MQHKKDSKGNTTQIPDKNFLQQGKYLFPAMNPMSLGLNMPDNMRLQSDTISNKQQDMFSAILSSMKDMVFIMDTENRILYMNKSAIDEYGVSLGKYCHQVICNSEVACQQTGMEAILKGQTVQLERTIKGKVYDSFVVPFVYRNNEIYKMEILRDITGRKQLGCCGGH